MKGGEKRMEDKKRTATVRPSRTGSVIGIIAAVLFLVFGVTFFSVVLSENTSEGGLRVLIAMFGLIWVTMCIVGIIYHTRNFRSWSGSPNDPAATSLGVFEYELAPDKENSADFEAKLRKLDGLKKDSLITEEEYKEKRREIMDEKW
ncbi:MAG TPA: hypothetical protein DIV80_03295 [Synergistaceae bacterium]|jgi:hypothetical protein|nr:hypothetical protein [Synergistaceae bacterium]